MRILPTALASSMRDSYRERSQRAVMGRRGCRATTDVGSRYEILAYIVWHHDAKSVEDSIEIAEGMQPGVVASQLFRSFEREFRREAAASRLSEIERTGTWIEWSPYRRDHDRDVDGLHIAQDDHTREVPDAVRASCGVGRNGPDKWELVPPRGITWGFFGPI